MFSCAHPKSSFTEPGVQVRYTDVPFRAVYVVRQWLWLLHLQEWAVPLRKAEEGAGAPEPELQGGEVVEVGLGGSVCETTAVVALTVEAGVAGEDPTPASVEAVPVLVSEVTTRVTVWVSTMVAGAMETTEMSVSVRNSVSVAVVSDAPSPTVAVTVTWSVAVSGGEVTVLRTVVVAGWVVGVSPPMGTTE